MANNTGLNKNDVISCVAAIVSIGIGFVGTIFGYKAGMQRAKEINAATGLNNQPNPTPATVDPLPKT